MCTATLVPLDGGFRLFESRDEQHGRMPGEPPQLRDLPGGGQALWPSDPVGGGTWVAVNGCGLALTLLNLNLAEEGLSVVESNVLCSRGEIIPRLARACSLEEALAQLPRMSTRPFRLVVTDGRRVFCWRSVDAPSAVRIEPVVGPMMWTSSGLGDHLVEEPRRTLFEGWADWSETGQRAFHLHRWDDRPALSVNMHREDARSVSMTEIVLTDGQLRMVYRPDWPQVSVDDPERNLACCA